MKNKSLLLTSALILSVSLSFAQNIIVSGKVKNQAGNILPQAMVEVVSTDIALTVDSAGEFSLGVKPKARLLISSPGYNDKEVKVDNNKNLTVVLTAKAGTDVNATSTGEGSTNRFANGLSQMQGAANSVIYGSSGTNMGSLIAVITHTENTRGSRYLNEDWRPGTVISTKDSVIKNPSYTFNYDKISGILLLSQDPTHAIEINKDQAKEFILTTSNGQPQTFAFVPEIDPSRYVQVLADGNKYKIYKQLNTKFIKNNYTTDGMTSRGNNYDEYTDEPVYYLLDVTSNKVNKIPTKKKALKEAFNNDKVTGYVSSHNGNIDDDYLNGLGNYLNQ